MKERRAEGQEGAGWVDNIVPPMKNLVRLHVNIAESPQMFNHGDDNRFFQLLLNDSAGFLWAAQCHRTRTLHCFRPVSVRAMQKQPKLWHIKIANTFNELSLARYKISRSAVE